MAGTQEKRPADKSLTRRSFSKKRATTGRKGRHSQISAYMYFFTCLADQSETLAEIMNLMDKAKAAKLATALELSSRNRLSAEFADVMAEITLENRIIAQDEMRSTIAGTLFVILNSDLRSMSRRVKEKGGKEGPVAAGRTIGKTSLYELIRAAGNNYRHFEEWNREILKNKNIAILKKAGLKGPWDRNLCMEIFEKIGWKTESELSLEVRKLASEIFRNQTSIPL
jgi:hypothetical protein